MLEIPGYKEAIAAERETRDYAFLELPRQICGIDVAPFTLYHLVTRLAIGCPFLTEQSVMDRKDPAGEIASFIWHVSEARRRTLGRPLDEYQARRKIVAALADPALSVSAAVLAIHSYLGDTFIDAPPSSAPKRPPVSSIAATLTDIFASEYGWTCRQVMHAPLEQLYQLIKEITLRHNPRAGGIFNRLSDKVRGEYLARINSAMFAAATPAAATP